MAQAPAGRVHTAAQGESVESLAHRSGLLAETIWEHPRNASLRDDTRTVHVLRPGDRVFIPELRVKEESCATNARHRLVCMRRMSRLHVRFLDEDTPRADASYTVTIDDGAPLRGTTDGDGYIDHVIIALAARAVVHFDADPEDTVFELWLGGLDPVSTPSGVQQRLRNLGLFWGDESEVWDADTTRALAGFQARHGLEANGTLDGATRDALVREHGS